MDIDERKKVVKGISITAVLGVIATVVGILANIHDLGWFEKDEPDLPSSSVADMQENPDDYAQPVIADENSEEETIPPAPTYSYTRLCDLEPSDYSDYSYNTDRAIKDTIGNSYSGNVTVFFNDDWFHKSDYVVYYLGGKYKTLTGTIAVNDESDGGSTYAIFDISGDDNILYTTGDITRLFAPTEFSINVEGVQWLRIDNKSYGGAYDNVGTILYNWQLE